MKILRRIVAALAATILAVLALPAAPAAALDGPVTRDDSFEGHAAGLVVGNVLANDTWDAGHTVTVVSATINKTWWAHPLNRSAPNCAIADPAVNAASDGTLTVNFGPNQCSQPSVPRAAGIYYTLQDTAGQQATGYAVFTDYNPDTPIVTNDDIVGPTGITGNGGFDWAPDGTAKVAAPRVARLNVQPLNNDVFGQEDRYTFEVVTPPADGSITDDRQTLGGFTYTRPYTLEDVPNVTETQGGVTRRSNWLTDSFTYRLCLVSNPTTCSNVATQTMNYRITESTMIPSDSIRRAFNPDGVQVWSIDVTAMRQTLKDRVAGDATYPAYTDAYIDSLTPAYQPTGVNNPAVQSLNSNGDGTWTWTLHQAPATDTGFQHDFVFRDADNVLAGRVSLFFRYLVSTPSTVRNDEVWVAVDDYTPMPVFANDTFGGTPYPTGMLWAGHEGTPFEKADGNRADILDAPRLGNFTDWNDQPYTTSQAQPAETVRLGYQAGSIEGTEVVPYRICPALVDSLCRPGQVTIHVSPRVAATNDVRTARPGDTFTVPVLSNDTFTDIPAKGAEVLVLTDVPAGVKARVKGDRAVEVTVPPGFQEDRFEFGYRLTDFTGTAMARVVVNVERDVPDTPPVVDPETPEPPVVEDPEPVARPTARNDHSTVSVGHKIALDLLDNDTYQDVGAVQIVDSEVLVGDSVASGAMRRDKGWSATETSDGRLVVRTSPVFKGDRIRVLYELTDATGETDTAWATIKVTRPRAVPPLIKGGGVFDLDDLLKDVAPVDAAADAPVAAASASQADVTGGTILMALIGMLTLIVGTRVQHQCARAQARKLWV